MANNGYDVKFATELPDELKCIVCHSYLRQPVQIMACGHRFCAQCFDEMKVRAHNTNTNLLCPIDREVVLPGQVFQDKAASRTIGNLKVECGNRDRGCTWVDDFRGLKDHEEKCRFRVVKDSKYEEMNVVLRELMRRMENYENVIISKDKDLAKLRLTVEELKEDRKLKDEEIILLKLSNAEHRSQSNIKDQEMKELKKIVNKLKNEFESFKESHRVLAGTNGGGVHATSWHSCGICVEEIFDEELKVHQVCGGLLCDPCLNNIMDVLDGERFPCPMCSRYISKDGYTPLVEPKQMA